MRQFRTTFTARRASQENPSRAHDPDEFVCPQQNLDPGVTGGQSRLRNGTLGRHQIDKYENLATLRCHRDYDDVTYGMNIPDLFAC